MQSIVDVQSSSAVRRFAARVADHELWWLAGLSLPLLFPRTLVPLTVLGLFCVPLLWCARWAVRGRLTRPSWLDLPILGLLIMLGVSVLVAPDPGLSLPKVTSMILGVALYYALLNHDEPLSILEWTPWLSWLIMLLGLVGIDWMSLKIPFLAPIYRLMPRLIQGVPRTMQGGFHPNEVAGTLTMLLPLVAAWWLARPATWIEDSSWPNWARMWRRWTHTRAFFLVTMLAMGGMLLLTQSRTGLMAACVALWLLGALRWRGWGWLTVVLIVVACVAVALIGPQAVLDRVLSLPSSYTWSGRPELWRNAWQIMRDDPLTGIGLNNFTPVSRLRYVYLIARPPWDFVHTHNILLQMGVDYGWLGLACFVGLVVGVGWLARRTYGLASAGQRWVLIGCVASLGGYLAFGSIDAITLGAKPSLLLWVAAGLVAQIALPARSVGSRRPFVQHAVVVGFILVAIVGLAFFRPLHSIWQSNLGNLALNHGGYANAVDRFQRALAANCLNLSARRGLAEAHAMMGDGEDALAVGVAAGYDAIYWSDRGASWYDQGELERARQWQQWSLELDPALGDAWYRLALVYEEQGLDAEAQQALERALEATHYVRIAPTAVMRYYLRARLMAQPLAIPPAAASAVAVLSPLERRVSQANTALDTGQVASAIAQVQAVLDEDDTLISAWTVLGKAHMRQRDGDRAILAFERAVALDPYRYWPSHLLATIYAERMEWRKVVTLETNVWQQAPDGERLVESTLGLLQAYESLEDQAGACRVLEQIAAWLQDDALRVRLMRLWGCD